MESHPSPALPPLLRIHLSTLLVMTLIAGAWMSLNFREYQMMASASVIEVQMAEGATYSTISKSVVTRGFPLSIHAARGVRAWNGPADIALSFDLLSLVLNCICGMFVMGGVAYAMEWYWHEKHNS